MERRRGLENYFGANISIPWTQNLVVCHRQKAALAGRAIPELRRRQVGGVCERYYWKNLSIFEGRYVGLLCDLPYHQ